MAIRIKEKVSSNGMRCGRFGGRWDKGTAGFLAVTFDEAMLDAGIKRAQIEGGWVGSCTDRVKVGNSAIPVATTLITMEERFISKVGNATRDILNGFHHHGGNGVPCRVDGGLKCFGHSIGSSGLRMTYEIYNKLLGRAGKRQLPSPSIGLTPNLGGVPFLVIAALGIFGLFASTHH